MKFFCSILLTLFFAISLFAQPYRTSWPMINGDPARTSNAQIDISFPLEKADVFPFGFSRAHGTILSEDKIFFSTRDEINSIHGVDLFSGDSLWTFEVPGTGGGIQFTPAVAHGVVLAGGQVGLGLYGLDANTGDVLWLAEIGSLYGRSPAIFDSLVYISSVSGLRCFDILTGEERWSHEGSTRTFTPVVDSLNVYFISDEIVYAKDRMTGEERWSTPGLSTGFYNALALDTSNVFISYNDTLSALNVQTGEVLWQTSLDTIEKSSAKIALTDTLLILRSDVEHTGENHYYIVEKATGNILNTYSKGTFSNSAPTVINNYLVDCSYDQITFLDIMTGDSIYSLRDLNFGKYPSQVVAAKDRIVIIAEGQKVVVLKSRPTSINNYTADFSAEIIPNPARSNIEVILDLLNASAVRLNIVSINGQLVGQYNMGFLYEGAHRIPISLESHSSGLYFVQIHTEQGIVAKKLFVE